MTGRTPTTALVKAEYCESIVRRPIGRTYGTASDDFDQWLAAHDREVRAKALEDVAGQWFANDTHGIARFTEEVQAELRKRAAEIREAHS